MHEPIYTILYTLFKKISEKRIDKKILCGRFIGNRKIMTIRQYYNQKKQQRENSFKKSKNQNMQTLLEKEQQEDKIKEEVFLKDILKTTIRNLTKRVIPAESSESFQQKFDDFWKSFIFFHEKREAFNINYIYKCVNNLSEHCERIHLPFDNNLASSIILQRFGGKMKNFNESADMVYKILTEKFGVLSNEAEIIKFFISSCSDIVTENSPPNHYKLSLLKDVYFHHLGGTWFEFISFQEKVYKERGILTRLEFFQCQKEILKLLISVNYKLYKSCFYIEKYEKNAKRNIEDYLVIIDERIEKLSNPGPYKVLAESESLF